MGFSVKIQEVNVEFVKNGKNGYEVANVNYLYKGEAKTTKIMSFSNPQVFKDVQKLVGKTVEVDTTQNGKYTNWAKLTVVEEGPDQKPTSYGTSTKPTSTAVRSTYETPEERAQRQLMIVRQSSISNAIEALKVTDKDADLLTIDNILEVAQQFVAFVYGKDALPEPESLEEMQDDIPY